MPGEHRPRRGLRRGFVIGELLVALLLLAVAVSSLAALMYSVSARAAGRREAACATSAAAAGKCVPEKPAIAAPFAVPASKLLRSGCATRSVYDTRNCKDTVLSAGSVEAGETVVKPRTDSAAMALLEKKQKAQRAAARTDRGFLR
jgi:Tfp pilus assembly protein PilV